MGNDRKRIPRSLRSEKEFYSVRARARTKKKISNEESLDFNGRISSLFSRVIVGSPSRAMMMMMMKMMMMMWHPRKKLLKASFFLFF